MKFVILALILFLIYTLFFKKGREGINMRPKKHPKKKIESDDMVECESCGVFVSLDESILKAQNYYCSKECAGKG